MGHFLSNFVGSTPDDPSLKLTTAREEVDLLKYQLEQMENKNGKLTKELDSSEEALYEAREMIDRRDEKLRQTKKWIEALERQRSRAERRVEDLERQIESQLC